MAFVPVRLSIVFHHMAMFVNRPTGLTVLVPKGQSGPNGGHQAILKTPGNETIPLGGETVRLLFKGKPIKSRTRRAIGQRLIHMDWVLGKAFGLKSKTKLQPQLNATFELGGGLLCENEPVLEPPYEHYANFVWTIGAHKQRLTNRTTFHFVVDQPGYSLKIDAVRGKPKPKYSEIKISDLQDTTIDVINLDKIKGTYSGRLDEFRAFYDFLDMGLVKNDGPVPEEIGSTVSAQVADRQNALEKYMGIKCQDAPACPQTQVDDPTSGD